MNRRRLLAAVAGVASVSVAGCLRLESGGTATDGETRRSTTAATATATASASATATEDSEETIADDDEATYPTGLHEDGVYAYLADTHLNQLSRTSFEERWQRQNQTAGTEHGANARIADGNALVTSPEHDGASYHTADGVHWRAPRGDDPLYGRADGTFDFQRVARISELRALLLGGAWSAPEAVDGGWRVEATGVDDTTAMRNRFGFASVESVSGEATVTPDGVVDGLQVVVEAVDDDRDSPFEVAFDHRVLSVGTATVPEPSWYQTAVDAAPDVTVRATEDGNYVVFEHRGGGDVAAGDQFHLHSTGENDVGFAHGRLDAPFAAGETLYAWVPSGTNDLEFRRGSRPSSANPRPLDGEFRTFVDHEGLEYFGFVRVRA
ncbi:hypothetical protein G9C85_09805 [Halorubellus sp. JP-L1]|uniref:hypothetical protein n=1 Tax=Halorubellus sp. JP-L1 TaxID=2715753 RepID=UPI00140CF41D|nr:hypothetical protein [Halorubellus sp. JP-L1]NHN41921.1 hypothetical protein [Halorubellus sp. JP-L1]